MQETQTKETQSNVQFGIIDISFFMIFLITSTIVSISSREISMFYYGNAIRMQFIDRPIFNEFEFEMTFDELTTVADWWSLMETMFSSNLPQFLGNQETDKPPNHILLGPPILRQIRVRNETCNIHVAFRNQFRTCYGEYSGRNVNLGEFEKGNVSQTHVNIYSVWGKAATYKESGFIEIFSIDAEENGKKLEELKSAYWIDRGTRMISLEFVSYNSHANFMSSTKILAEFLPSGGVLMSNSIQVLRLKLINDKLVDYFWNLLFLTLLLLYTFERILRVKANGVASIFNSFWSLLDTGVVVLYYLSLTYIIWHQIYLNKVLSMNMEEKQPYDLIFTLDVLFYWNLYFNFAVALAIFLVWMKSLKYIQMSRTMKNFCLTLKTCTASLLGFAVMFAIVFVAYADLSVLIFGTADYEFRDFPTAMLTMIRMVFGDLYYSVMEEVSPILGPIVFLSYVLLVFFILLNMFLGIIADTFSEVKSKTAESERRPLSEFFKKLVRMKFGKKSDPSKDDETTSDIDHPKKKLSERKPLRKTQEDQNELEKRVTALEILINNLQDRLIKRLKVISN